jgi:hypothetical protein
MYIYGHMSIHIYMYLYICIYVSLCKYLYLDIFMYIDIHIYMHMYLCIYMFPHFCMPTFILISTFIYTNKINLFVYIAYIHIFLYDYKNYHELGDKKTEYCADVLWSSLTIGKDDKEDDVMGNECSLLGTFNYIFIYINAYLCIIMYLY